MKLKSGKATCGRWGIYFPGAKEMTALINGNEDYTAKNIAERIEKCVNAFGNIVDIDGAIKEFMEWKADKALTTQK